MKIFLDTSVLSDEKLSALTEDVVSHRSKGDQFFVSSITHFEILWGYLTAHQSPQNYEEFLRAIPVEVVPLTRHGAEHAAELKPAVVQVLDALIASTVRKYDGKIWTFDSDFLKFLPKTSVRILGR